MSDKPDQRPDGPNVSEDEDPQAMGLFTEPTEPDVHLDPDHPAFDRVQDGRKADEE
ncbi:hypothetical protein RQM47_12435 [Rubrivirga sp. S365]|uniref:Uncharacterized protein n=1 Tax=Rubrivirga litoralis TaxID=3075598 RepID=A0ABU3BUE7_9BACT|nr:MULTISPECIES: hypothetical protein [unclassified Rubrivirga]MDT0632903.1 hypothetical protein [Rubrivirga sp. F394]MDT7857452.1 hypothetical protein [Rubrivirga sp. S365]